MPEAPPPRPASVLDIKVLHDGWGRFLMARLRLGDGQEVDREVEDHGRAVAVLPYDPERRVALLVRQMRTPALVGAGLQDMLEAPAGRLETDDPAACAVREAFEEVGVKLDALEPVVASWTMPAVSTEVMHLFLAPFSEKDMRGTGGGLPEEGEDIVVETVPLRRLAAMADAGDLVDAKTLILLLSLRHRRPDLFS